MPYVLPLEPSDDSAMLLLAFLQVKVFASTSILYYQWLKGQAVDLIHETQGDSGELVFEIVHEEIV